LLSCVDCREWADALDGRRVESARGEAENVTAIIRRSATRATPAPGDAGSAFPYINREISSLEFNHRVLYEAGDDRNPLLERVKFLAIFASNMDEFFQIRVSGLMEQAEAHATPANPGDAFASCWTSSSKRSSAYVPASARRGST
jgi:hypothetical protein